MSDKDNKTNNEILEEIIGSLNTLDYIRPREIPGIDLYMDQVTTFMDSQLASSRRSDDDKILTKTMINNYAKNHLLPPPEKKKYSREHMILLIFIYYFKNLLSISDIQSLLSPLTEKYFHTDNPLQLEQIYEEVFTLEKNQIDEIKSDILEQFHAAENTFTDAPEDERQALQIFSFVCGLAFDVYLKKKVIETILDENPLYNNNPDKPETKRHGKKDKTEQ